MRGSVPQRPASAGPTLSAAEALAKLTPARRVAFEILTLVGLGKGHSDELLHSARTEALSAEDRNLATALVMGVLRWEIALDARLRGYLERPDQRLAAPVALALRLGAMQLLHMDRIPAHAALSESVELCRAAGEPHATGMVNAVLRKLAAEVASKKPKGSPLFETTARFAERLGHPRWLVERWVATYGREAALKICEAGQKEPDEPAMFAHSEAAGEGPVPVPTMDDGSRLVAELAAAAAPEAKRIWDCCAAPGGKTLVLALREPAAEILATDVSVKRTALMRTRLERYGYGERLRCAVADAAITQTDEAGFDLILCDVPCSGTGTLARNPEIRHRLKLEELERQSARQRAILTGALQRLAVGGRLVYSTCSLEPEENEQVLDAVASGTEFRRVPVDGLLQSLAASGVLRAGVDLGSAVRDGALRTLPGVHGCDGFYAVVVERLA
ncbi:MAG TPA: transcription antitermination factor NusB [Granulicella sp.]|nr:transcription antitermination factor NusB [Granulicella sp.]